METGFTEIFRSATTAVIRETTTIVATMSAIGTMIATEESHPCRHPADIIRMATVNRMLPRLRTNEIGIMTSTMPMVDRAMSMTTQVILANTRIPALIPPHGRDHTRLAVALVLVRLEKVTMRLGLP